MPLMLICYMDWTQNTVVLYLTPWLTWVHIFRGVWLEFNSKLMVVRHPERFSTPDASSQIQWQDAERKCHLEKETKKPVCSVRDDTLACQRTSTETGTVSQTEYRMSAKDATDGTCNEKAEETTVLLEIFQNHYTWGSPAIRFRMFERQCAKFSYVQYVKASNQLDLGIIRNDFIDGLRVCCDGLCPQLTYLSHQGIGVRC